MIWSSTRSSDGGDEAGDEEDTGGGGDTNTGTRTVERRGRGRYVSGKSLTTTLLLLFVLSFTTTGASAKSTNLTFKGEKQTDVDSRLGNPAFLPCELEPNNVTDGTIVTPRCGMVHSVKWYRGANRIFLYTGGIRVTQPQRDGYSDRYDNVYWSAIPGNTTGYLVIDNITAMDEGVYKCEITYTKVHEGCNIIQFINLTTYSDPGSISVGTLAEPGDLSSFNYDDPKSDFYDTKDSNPKFGIMKRLITGNSVGPVDEGSKIRLVCRAGRTRPVPQITWWQHNRGQIYDEDMIDYKYRSVDSYEFEDYDSNTGLYISQSVLTVVGKRGANGRYECRVKTVVESSKTLAAAIDVIVNVSPYSVEMSSSTSGPTVSKISKVDDRQRSENGEHDKNAEEVVYAETTEGQPLVIRCAARGARPQANVTWYYYYNDQQDDDNDYANGIRNEFNARTSAGQPSKSSKHGPPVMLGSSHRNHGGSATARSPSDYLISEQRRVENGAEIIGPVEIAQHTEYQSDGTRDTHSQLSMTQLHRSQDGSVLRCDAFNNVGSSPSQPLTVNMTIRVKFIPTAWVVPLTEGENSGAIVEDEIKTENDQKHKGTEGPNFNPSGVNDASKSTNDGLHYQTSLYTVLVNETKELRLLCAFHANPDKLRTPVKWYHDGNELQLVDENEQTQSNYGSHYSMPTNGGGPSNARYPSMVNPPKHARVKGFPNANNRLYGDGNGEDATVLVIRRLTRSDSGRYECRVRNSVGAANSTNFANVRVQYSPKVKLHVILDDSYDDNKTSSNSNDMIGSNPIIIESHHRNVTLLCAVKLDPDQQNIEDVDSDPSLNLTFVHWYWNGVQMQLPNCTKSSDSNDLNSDIFEDENDGDSDFDLLQENDNNAMNVNYYSETNEGDPDYDSFTVDNDTRKRNRKLRKIVCTERELILVNVTKNIHGNYSCRARNSAGLLTPMSDQTPLIVYFAPGPVTLEFSPALVIKERNVTLRCNAQYLGRPQHPTYYSWFRDGQRVYPQNQGPAYSGTGIGSNSNGNNGRGDSNPEWFIEHVSLETRANFTCSAWNKGGTTYSEPVSIDVKAPPNYITGPPQYLGVVFNATHVNASCTVECVPTCFVYWLRKGVLIDPINNSYDRDRYVILIENVNSTRTKNDFEAVRSTLIWRMDNWPGGQGLDPKTDSFEYSCRSSGNEVGPPVNETVMHFSVEFPPCNMTVSKSVVNVTEGNIPEKVFCHADSSPLPSYEWRFTANTNNWMVPGSSASLTAAQQKLLAIGNGGIGSTVGSSSGSGTQSNNQERLVLNTAVTRQQAGYYACIARNPHGNNTAYTYLDVMYKPSCQLRLLTVEQLKQEINNGAEQSAESGTEELNDLSGEKRLLVCTATANPSQVQYTWKVRNSGRQNDTSTPSSTSGSPATERIITMPMRLRKSGSTDIDGIPSLNMSVLVLDDVLEVQDDDDNDTEENGKGSDNAQNKPTEGVRTYVCTVNNTVGSDQCTIQVQGDAPWWKQLLATIGLGGLPVMVVLVGLVVILLVIVIVIIVILLLFVCKNRYLKPGNGANGGRQKYGRGAGQQQDNDSNLGTAGETKAAFYENLPFHGMRPPPNQLTGVGIGARSLDEFYRMQIQQHESLYHRVTEDEAAAALSAGYATPVDGTRSANSLHHRQQSIEMTQFDGRGSNGGTIVESYQKPKKHLQHRNAHRTVDGDDYDVEDDIDGVRLQSIANVGTMGRRRRAAGQQVLGGASSAGAGSFTGNGGHPYHHHQQQQQQHGLTTRRRSNNTAGGVGAANCLSNLQPAAGAASNTPSNYNTVGGGSVGYYAAEVYATMESRQQQAKQQQQQQQQQQRSYLGGGGDCIAGSADIVSAENTLAAKRSWRRQQNRRRRAAGVGGVSAIESAGCETDAGPGAVRPASDYAASVMDTVIGGGGRTGMKSEDPTALLESGRYRGTIATTTQLEHHHRPWQKTDVRGSTAPGSHPLADGPSSSAAAGLSADQHAANSVGAGINNGNNNASKNNVVKFHDVGREIDV